MNFLGGSSEGTRTQLWVFGILGVVIVLAIWIPLTAGADPVIPPITLPSPWKVIMAVPEMLNENELLKNVGFSLGLNLSGYVEALLITIPFGFIIGLFRYARWGFQAQVNALRYVHTLVWDL